MLQEASRNSLSGDGPMRVAPVVTDAAAGKRNLDEFGYTIHKDFLDADQLRTLRERLEEQAALEIEQGVGSFEDTLFANGQWRGPEDGPIPPVQIVQTLINKGRCFVELARHPILQAYAGHLFDRRPYYINSVFGALVRKGARSQALHRDQERIPVDLPVPAALNCTIALSDFKEEMGATRLVPGTHRGPRPPREGGETTHLGHNVGSIPSIPAVATAGSAILWEGRLWHGRGESVSDETRFSVTVGVSQSWYRTLESIPGVLLDSVFETLSEDELALFGFKEQATQTGPRNDTPHKSRNSEYVRPYVPELRRGGSGRAARIDRIDE